MRVLIKIILIAFGFVLFAIPFSILKSLNGISSGISGMIGFALLIGFIAGARAIWNYNPKEKDNSKDIHTLNKN
jgi:hypothetical protein